MSEPTLQAQIEAANAYETVFVPALFGHWASKVVDAAELQPGSRALDAACGTGILARAVAVRVRFEVAKAKEYPVADYDFVTMFDCLHDMGDPVGAAAHVRQSLKRDGHWMIVKPFANDELQENELVASFRSRRSISQWPRCMATAAYEGGAVRKMGVFRSRVGGRNARARSIFFGPYAADALLSQVSVFSYYFKRLERFTKLATSSDVAPVGQSLGMA